MPRVQRRTKTPTRSGKPKTDWVLIEGNSPTVLKTIGGILERTGDDRFEVEFRIYRSSRTSETSAAGARGDPSRKPRRKKGLGSLTTIFVPRRKRRR